MPLTIITPAEGDPVTLDEAKAFARVADDDEDDLIAGLITAATEEIEKLTGRQFVPATFLLTMRCAPRDGVIRLPRSPLIEVTSVKHRDSDGALQTLTDEVDYLVDAAAEPPGM